MNIRERQEKWEKEYFSPYAVLSSATLGRDREEKECDIRTSFQRDRDRILHCKSFRRLKHKTQVFLEPEGDHYRTRLTHTLEVAQNARTIARALRLNEDLTEAIALGHDLGHTPFGHAGEKALDEISQNGFRHNEQSIRVVEVVEKSGQGLNLTKEVRDGILNHKSSGNPMTLEGKIVQLSDKIAYVNHDIDDAVRAGLLKEEDLPKKDTDILGHSNRERLNTAIHDIVQNSLNENDIIMSPEVKNAMYDLRAFMFREVYVNERAKSEEIKAIRLVQSLFKYYINNTDTLPEEYFSMISPGNEEKVVCDYIAGMTDRYAITKFQEIYEPKAWKGM